MNKIFLLIAVCSWAVLVACGRNDDDGPRPESAYIKLDVAGKSWSSDGVVVIGTSVVDGKYNFSMVGTDKTFEGETSGFSAIFSTTNEINTGTYVLADWDGGASITKVDGKTYLTGVGANFVIQITEVRGSGPTRKFKGTFSGELKGPSAGDVVMVSNGEFSSL